MAMRYIHCVLTKCRQVIHKRKPLAERVEWPPPVKGKVFQKCHERGEVWVRVQI